MVNASKYLPFFVFASSIQFDTILHFQIDLFGELGDNFPDFDSGGSLPDTSPDTLIGFHDNRFDSSLVFFFFFSFSL